MVGQFWPAMVITKFIKCERPIQPSAPLDQVQKDRISDVQDGGQRILISRAVPLGRGDEIFGAVPLSRSDLISGAISLGRGDLRDGRPNFHGCFFRQGRPNFRGTSSKQGQARFSRQTRPKARAT